MLNATNCSNKIEEEIDFAELNYRKIHKQLRETLYRQRELKKELNLKIDAQDEAFWRKRCASRREFSSLSGKMTNLCCLLAHSKGELHMKRARTFFCSPVTIDVTMEMQRKVIGHFWKEYVIQ